GTERAVRLHGASGAIARHRAAGSTPKCGRTAHPASPTLAAMSDADAFRAARDLLLACRGDDARAQREVAWPAVTEVNWARDWVDKGPRRAGVALHVITQGAGETRLTYGELSEGSDRLANGLRDRGVGRGDRLLLMLGNVPELWTTMLAAIKLGAVLIP